MPVSCHLSMHFFDRLKGWRELPSKLIEFTFGNILEYFKYRQNEPVGKKCRINFFPIPFLWLLIHVCDKNGLWSFPVLFVLYMLVFFSSQIFATAIQYLLNRQFCRVSKNTSQRIKKWPTDRSNVFFSCLTLREIECIRFLLLYVLVFRIVSDLRINLFYWKRHLP